MLCMLFDAPFPPPGRLYMGIFGASFIHKSQRALNCVSATLSKPAASITNSSPLLSAGTPGTSAVVSLRALASPVLKKDEIAPV
jgi:hypothetical protein